jgi:hypothetical protein
VVEHFRIGLDARVIELKAGPKRRRSGRKRWQRELVGKPGKWHQSDRATWQQNDANRVAGTFTELVTDALTDEVLLSKTESIQDRTGHGSDKPTRSGAAKRTPGSSSPPRRKS